MFFTSIATEKAHTNNQNALKSEPVTNSHSTTTEKTVESHPEVKSQDINAQYLPVIKEHSLISPFINGYWSDGIPHWDFYDSAVVTSNYIRLTPDVPSTYGSIWNTNRIENHAMCDEEYEQMLQLNPQIERSGYEFQITFRIWSQRTYGADGMGLFFTDEIPEQKNGPLMGHSGEFTGIAIILIPLITIIMVMVLLFGYYRETLKNTRIILEITNRYLLNPVELQDMSIPKS